MFSPNVVLTYAQTSETPPSLSEKLHALVGIQGGLTSDEVARRAELTNGSIAAQRAQEKVAEAFVDQATVGFAPRVTLNGRYARLSRITPPILGNSVSAPGVAPGPLPEDATLVVTGTRFPVILNQTLGQVYLNVPVSDYLLRLSQTYSSTSHSREAARHYRMAEIRRVRADAKIAYYTWARAVLMLAVAQQSLTQAQGHLRDVKSNFTHGAASQADVLRVESQLADAEQLVMRVTNLRDATAQRLVTLMHDVPVANYAIGEDLETPLSEQGTAALSQLYSNAIRLRPEVRALERTRLSLVQEAKATSANQWPRLDAFGEATVANPNPRYTPQQPRFRTTWSAGLQLSWSPNDVFGAGAAASATRARASQTEAQKRVLVDTLRSELVDALQALKDADAAIPTTTRGLAAAEESYRVRKLLFQNSRATNVELTDAETDVLRARLDSVNARIDQRIARVRLEYATGN